MSIIAKEVFQEWLNHPVTEALVAQAKADREDILAAYSAGSWLSDETGNAAAVGQLKYINWLLESFNPSEEGE